MITSGSESCPAPAQHHRTEQGGLAGQRKPGVFGKQ